jgi:ATP-binding cassette subfamily B protein/subfamily B ATP-binding cassette protein MsbA
MRSSSSRTHYNTFRERYREHRLDEPAETASRETPKRAQPGSGQRHNYFRDYLDWLWPHGYAIGTVFFLAALGAGLQMTQPLLMRFVIDRVLLVPELDTATRLARLHLAGTALLAATCLLLALGLLRGYWQRVVTVRSMLTLRRSLYERLLRLPLAALWDMKTGGILTRLNGDTGSTTGLLQMAIISPAISTVRILIAIAVLLTVNWELALVALATIPAVMLLSFISATRVRPIYKTLQKDVERVNSRVGETFSGIRVVRAFGREMRELFDYVRDRHAIVRKELFAHRRELVIQTSWGFLLSISSVVIVWYGGLLFMENRATIGDIMAFQWCAFLLLNPAGQIVTSFSQLQQSLAAMERVFEVLGTPDDKPDRPGAMDAPAVVREIEFQSVEFEYRAGRPVVRDFNLVVPRGAMVALIGHSGAGKTTVTDLIARFHDPTRGRILLNGVDVRDLKLKTYRRLFAIVQQSVFLFDGSVRDNIAYGRRDASDAEIEDAARRANAHEFIVALPEKYETFVGERGVKLSGGQQQRLAIARALVASPQILILDEVTNNLDAESERLIEASLTTLLADRTTFVIGHRLSTVRNADLIVLLENGRIIEHGSHASLMAAQGQYYAMVLQQMTSGSVASATPLSA